MSSVDTTEYLALKADLDAANGRIKELENVEEILREKKSRLEQELGIAKEKMRHLESSERSQALKLSELEDTARTSNIEVNKVTVLLIVQLHDRADFIC